MFELVLVVAACLMVWVLAKLLRREAIFIPLPHGTVRQMLKLARVKKNDVLYDLGAGDGRVVKIAAKEFGCRAVGVEKDAILCWLARRNVKREKLDKVKIIRGDIFRQNFSDATVVAMYLSGKLNEQLKAKLAKLKKGTRIVSADHVFKGWKEVGKVKTGHFYCYLYKI